MSHISLSGSISHYEFADVSGTITKKENLNAATTAICNSNLASLVAKRPAQSWAPVGAKLSRVPMHPPVSGCANADKRNGQVPRVWGKVPTTRRSFSWSCFIDVHSWANSDFVADIWWFPEIGVPHHPFLDGIVPYKPTILDTSIYGNPHIYTLDGALNQS